MAIYQTPSSRIADCLRNAGLAVLLIFVLKSFLVWTVDPARQTTIDTKKGLREPYLTPVSTSDALPGKANEDAVPFSEESFMEVDEDDELPDNENLQDKAVDDDDDDQYSSNETKEPVLSLHLIGERHCGTKWMSAHLKSCFPNVRFSNNPYRWKHWFQDESIVKHPEERFVMVAQFRNPFTWTEAMRSFPHHAPEHFHLDWSDFATRTWMMPRYGPDLKYAGWTADLSREEHAPMCTTGDFFPHEVIPCMANRTTTSSRGISMEALYELRHDGSGKPYDNILDMRKEKIENFLSVADFERVEDLFVIRYEEAKLFGTSKLIKVLEKSLGMKAACEPQAGDPNFRERQIPDQFREYLKTHVHWETEEKIGYFPADAY